MNPDPIVEEVRRIRNELARKFNYDIHAICQDAMARQGKTLTPDELTAIRAKLAPASDPLAVHEKSDSDYEPH